MSVSLFTTRRLFIFSPRSVGRPGHSRSQSFDHTFSDKSVTRNRANSNSSGDSYAVAGDQSESHVEEDIAIGSYKSTSRLETIDEVSLTSEQVRNTFISSSPRPFRSSTMISAQSGSSSANPQTGNASPVPYRPDINYCQQFQLHSDPSIRVINPPSYNGPENKLFVGKLGKV